MKSTEFATELQKRIEELVKTLAKEYPTVYGNISIKVDFESRSEQP